MAWLALWCGAGPAFATFSITHPTGTLTFPKTTLNGADQVVTATAVPKWRVTVSLNSGWNVTLQMTDFSAGAATIPATGLSYTATNGTIVHNKGQSIDPTNGPIETGLSGNLGTALKCVDTQPNYGNGQYTWVADPSQFALTVPATTLVGSYSATLTATLVSGP